MQVQKLKCQLEIKMMKLLIFIAIVNALDSFYHFGQPNLVSPSNAQ